MGDLKKRLLTRAKESGYAGDSLIESKEWLLALRKGLEMSVEARLARAQSLGFNTETIFHHGTSEDFEVFDKASIGKNYTYSQDSGFFFTQNLNSAKNYAFLHGGGEAEGRVISAYLRYENTLVNQANSDYYGPADRFDLMSADLLREAEQRGCDSILIRGTRNDDLCVVFEPAQIRSIHSAFDPDFDYERHLKPDIDVTGLEF